MLPAERRQCDRNRALPGDACLQASPGSVLRVEHLREYQDYVLAHRLRVLVGGALEPPVAMLSLAEYARKRLERQALARELLGSGAYQTKMRRVDVLTDETNFGFWQNPNETVVVLKKIIGAGGSPAVESEDGFVAALLTQEELARIGPEAAQRVARYYLGLLRASAAYLDPEVFTRLRSDIDPLRDDLPIFVPVGEDATPASQA